MNDTHGQHLTKLPHAPVTKVQTETAVSLPVFHNTTLVKARLFSVWTAIIFPCSVFQCITTQ